jgi:hypothetical protein
MRPKYPRNTAKNIVFFARRKELTKGTRRMGLQAGGDSEESPEVTLQSEWLAGEYAIKEEVLRLMTPSGFGGKTSRNPRQLSNEQGGPDSNWIRSALRFSGTLPWNEMARLAVSGARGGGEPAGPSHKT